MPEEKLEVPEEYKKAFNQADKLVSHMPQVLDGLKLPEDKSEYSQGFRDRIELYNQERETTKNRSYQKLNKIYGKSSPDPPRTKDKNKDERDR